MKREKSQGFLRGAAILGVAGMLVKAIGACYKIPLGRILGPIGMASFSVAYNIYALLFTLSTAGVPAAVSKMISECAAKRRYGEMYGTYKVAYISFAVIGVCGFAIMFFGAETLARFMGNADAALSVRAISPAVLFVSVSAVTRGYFQGRSDMYPTAVSELTEAVGKLTVGLALAFVIKRFGYSDDVVSAGAVFGVSAGAFLSALYFVFCKDDLKTRDKVKTNAFPILGKLMSLAIPITLGASVISFTNVIDSALVMNLLRTGSGSQYRAKWLFGAYTYATTVFNLPSALISTLAVSLLPALSRAFAGREYVTLDRTANSAMRVAMMIAVPAAFGMCALSREIISILFGSGLDAECIDISGRLLMYLSGAVIPLSAVTVTNSIHQSFGRVVTPVFSMLAGAGIKLALNFFLVKNPTINIYGAAISTVVCYCTIAFLNIITLRKYSFLEVRLTEILAKPLCIGLCVFASAYGCRKLTSGVFNLEISTFLSLFVGFMTCIICALVMNFEDIKLVKKLVGKKK